MPWLVTRTSSEPVRLDGLLDHPLRVVRARHVAADRVPAERERGHRRRLPVEVGADDPRALGGERGAAGAPDPAGGAGDERRLALEPRLHRYSPEPQGRASCTISTAFPSGSST